MAVAFLPFPASLLGEYSEEQVSSPRFVCVCLWQEAGHGTKARRLGRLHRKDRRYSENSAGDQYVQVSELVHRAQQFGRLLRRRGRWRGSRFDRDGAIRSLASKGTTLYHAGKTGQCPYGEQDILGEDEATCLLVYLLAREPEPPGEPRCGRRGEGGYVDDVVAVPSGVQDLATVSLGVYGAEARVQCDLAEKQASEAGAESEIVSHPSGGREHAHR